MTYSSKTDKYPILESLLKEAAYEVEQDDADSFAKKKNDEINQRAIAELERTMGSRRGWYDKYIGDPSLKVVNTTKDWLGNVADYLPSFGSSRFEDVLEEKLKPVRKAHAKATQEVKKDMSWLDNAKSRADRANVGATENTRNSAVGAVQHGKQGLQYGNDGVYVGNSTQNLDLAPDPKGRNYSVISNIDAITSGKSNRNDRIMTNDQWADFKKKNGLTGMSNEQISAKMKDSSELRNAVALRMRLRGMNFDEYDAEANKIYNQKLTPEQTKTRMDFHRGGGGTHTVDKLKREAVESGKADEIEQGMFDPQSPYFDPEMAQTASLKMTNSTPEEAKLFDAKKRSRASTRYATNEIKKLTPNDKTVDEVAPTNYYPEMYTKGYKNPGGKSMKPKPTDYSGMYTDNKKLTGKSIKPEPPKPAPELPKEQPNPLSPYTVDKDTFAKRVKDDFNAGPEMKPLKKPTQNYDRM